MRKVFAAILALGVIALAAYGAWHLLSRGEARRELDRFMQPLLDGVVASAVDAMRPERMPAGVYILPVRGDVLDGLVKERLRDAIARRGCTRIVDQASMGERLKDASDGILGRIAAELLGEDPALPLDAVKAAAFLKEYALPGLLWAEAAVVENEREGQVGLTLQVLDQTGATVYETRVARVMRKHLLCWPYIKARVMEASLAWRMVGWLLFVALLPLASWPALGPLLRQESNVRNASALVGLTAMSALALWFLLGFEGTALTAAAVGVLGVGLSGAYHFCALEVFEALRH